MQRLVHWQGTDEWRAEVSDVRLDADGIRARGVQLGVDPLPYRLDYALDAGDGWMTRSLSAEATGEGWSRRLSLVRDSGDIWSIEVEASGETTLAEPGGPARELASALDCDLGFSPLTNLMPIRRSGLDREPGAQDFLMAWVAVPELAVFASGQRYEHVSAADEHSVVRYVDRGRFAGFTAELHLDRDGLAIDYPGLARRVTAS